MKIIKRIILPALFIWGGSFIFAQAASHSVGINIIAPDNTVYTISLENGQTVRRPYTSAGAFLSYSFNTWETLMGASAEDLALPLGSFIAPQDGKIICSDRGTDRGTCYLITGGKKAGFTTAEVFTRLGYDFRHAIFGDVSFLTTDTNIDTATESHRSGALVNVDGTIYLVAGNGLLGLPSWDILTSWGYVVSDIIPANSADRDLPILGVVTPKQPEQLSPISPSSASPASVNTAPDFSMPFAYNPTGTSYAINSPLSASFSANDKEGGFLSAKVEWGDYDSEILKVYAQPGLPAIFPQIYHTYDQTGSYLITITVSDSGNLSSIKTASVFVVAPSIANPPPNTDTAIVYGTNPTNNTRYVAAGQTYAPIFSFKVYAASSKALNITGYNFEMQKFPAGGWVDGLVSSFAVVDSANSNSRTALSTVLYQGKFQATYNAGQSIQIPAGQSKEFTVYADVSPSLSAGDLSITLRRIQNTDNQVVTNDDFINGVINVSRSSPYISDLNMTDGVEGQDYSMQFHVTGGTAPYKWENYYTTHPCCYVGINQSTGVFSNQGAGLKPLAGTWQIGIRATDANGQKYEKIFTWYVKQNSANPLTITTSGLPTAFTGNTYVYQLQASGGTAPYSWGLGNGGTLPCCWLNVSSSGLVTAYNGVVGQYDAPGGKSTGNNLIGDWTVAFYVTDTSGQTATKILNWKVKPYIAILTGSLPNAKVGSNYNAQIQYRYYSNDNYLNTVSVDALPSGLKVDALDGSQPQTGPGIVKALFSNPDSNGIRTFAIIGAPTQSGNFSFALTLEDSAQTAKGVIIYILKVDP